MSDSDQKLSLADASRWFRVNCSEEKLKKACEALRAKKFCLVMDFDYTISIPQWMDPVEEGGANSNPGSSFTVLNSPGVLSKDGENKMSELYRTYRPVEEDYSMDSKKREELINYWYSESLDILRECYKDMEDVRKVIKKDRSLRLKSGFSNIVESLDSPKQVDQSGDSIKCGTSKDLIIVSAGLSEVIEAKFDAERLDTSNLHIVSNKIFDAKSVLITSQNKSMSLIDSDMIGQNVHYVILVGDNLHDYRIVDEQGLEKLNRGHTVEVLKIGLLNFKALYDLKVHKYGKSGVEGGNSLNFEQYIELADQLADEDRKQFFYNLESFNKQFDLVVINDETLESVLELLSWD